MWVTLVKPHPNHPPGATVRLGIAEARRLIDFGIAVPAEIEFTMKRAAEKRKRRK